MSLLRESKQYSLRWPGEADMSPPNKPTKGRYYCQFVNISREIYEVDTWPMIQLCNNQIPNPTVTGSHWIPVRTVLRQQTTLLMS